MHEQHPNDGERKSERRSDVEAVEIRASLHAALREILQLASDIAIGVRSPADLGLTSLGAITLQYKLQSMWGIELTISEILGATTIDALVALARSRRGSSHATDHRTSYQKSGVLI